MSPERLEPYPDDAERLASLRALLPATGAGIYLDTLTAGPLPEETARALAEADEWDLRTGRAGRDRDLDLGARMAEACGVLAALLGGDPDDIFLTHGVEDALRLARELTRRPLQIVRHVNETTGSFAELTSALGRPVVVDARASAGVVPLRASELDVAAIAISGQTWLHGPEGTGALWIDRRVFPNAPAGPLAPGWDVPARRSVLGFARSVGWLEMYIGLPWVHARIARLAAALHGALREIPGVELVTPAGAGSGLLSFRIRGWTADQAADEFGARAFAILGPPPAPDVVRISFGAFNSEEELGRFVEVVGLLAAHTPETLPRRPSLIVLQADHG